MALHTAADGDGPSLEAAGAGARVPPLHTHQSLQWISFPILYSNGCMHWKSPERLLLLIFNVYSLTPFQDDLPESITNSE